MFTEEFSRSDLLKYSALAAGFEYECDSSGSVYYVKKTKSPSSAVFSWVVWNPIDNGHTCFDLAVLSHTTVAHECYFMDNRRGVIAELPDGTGIGCVYDSDPEAATRLAVVKAAAHKGKLLEVKQMELFDDH